METCVSSASKTVFISDQGLTVLIGDRINPSGKKKLAYTLHSGEMELVCKIAVEQVVAGADILDLNVGVSGIDQVDLLPKAVQAVMDVVDVPLCLDSDNPAALEAAIKAYRGKPIINSVSGQERSLEQILPLVKEYGTSVIGLTLDDEGIPNNSDKRVDIAHKIIERAEAFKIPREDIIIDCLALTVGANSQAGLVILEAIRRIKAELGVYLTLGASNISFGLPDRELLNGVFLAISIAMGVNCPIVDVASIRPAVLATDLILGHDKDAMRYIKAHRQRKLIPNFRTK